MENFRMEDYDTLIVLGALIIWHIRHCYQVASSF